MQARRLSSAIGPAATELDFYRRRLARAAAQLLLLLQTRYAPPHPVGFVELFSLVPDTNAANAARGANAAAVAIYGRCWRRCVLVLQFVLHSFFPLLQLSLVLPAGLQFCTRLCWRWSAACYSFFIYCANWRLQPAPNSWHLRKTIQWPLLSQLPLPLLLHRVAEGNTPCHQYRHRSRRTCSAAAPVVAS